MKFDPPKTAVLYFLQMVMQSKKNQRGGYEDLPLLGSWGTPDIKFPITVATRQLFLSLRAARKHVFKSFNAKI